MILPLVSFTSSEPFSYFLKHSFSENCNHVPDGKTRTKIEHYSMHTTTTRIYLNTVTPRKYNQKLSNLNLKFNHSGFRSKARVIKCKPFLVAKRGGGGGVGGHGPRLSMRNILLFGVLASLYLFTKRMIDPKSKITEVSLCSLR